MVQNLELAFTTDSEANPGTSKARILGAVYNLTALDSDISIDDYTVSGLGFVPSSDGENFTGIEMQTTDGEQWSGDPNNLTGHAFENGEIYLNGTDGPQAKSNSGEKSAHIGNYYNFQLATAYSNSRRELTGNSAISSICPLSWKIPDRTGEKGYIHLLTEAYKLKTESDLNDNNESSQSVKVERSPLSFLRTGQYYSNRVGLQTIVGRYFMSTLFDNLEHNYVYSFDFSNTYFYARDYNVSTVATGRVIRCVAK